MSTTEQIKSPPKNIAAALSSSSNDTVAVADSLKVETSTSSIISSKPSPAKSDAGRELQTSKSNVSGSSNTNANKASSSVTSSNDQSSKIIALEATIQRLTKQLQKVKKQKNLAADLLDKRALEHEEEIKVHENKYMQLVKMHDNEVKQNNIRCQELSDSNLELSERLKEMDEELNAAKEVIDILQQQNLELQEETSKLKLDESDFPDYTDEDYEDGSSLGTSSAVTSPAIVLIIVISHQLIIRHP